ncbi:hypothetical protein IFM89_014064 [Coptis chinensis]|uniref:Transposase MuDR plant domain-containing protein n=1 Tax=Coptis chinensis TaxID=261450 RepID=A0A835LQB0_9MAGN|nr:hypothetical protein IFM89_014064 [Coptis chinensis]
MRTLRGDRVFELHYDGFWMLFAPGKVNYSMYRGVDMCDYEVNGEEMCYLDLLKEIHKKFGDDKPVSCVKFIVRGHLTYFNNDKDMLKMWNLIKPERDKKYHLFVTPSSFEESLQPSEAQPSVNKPLKPPTSNKQPKILSTPKATNQINHEDWTTVIDSGVAFKDLVDNEVEDCDGGVIEDDEVDMFIQVRDEYGPSIKLSTAYVSEPSSNEEDIDFVPNLIDKDSEGEEPNLVDEQPDLDGDNNDEDDDISAFVKLPKNLYADEKQERIEGNGTTEVRLQLLPKMEWRTFKECRKFMKNLTIYQKFSYEQVRNNKTRIHLKCKDPECGWRVYCTVMSDKHTFKLKNYVETHTCEADGKNKNAQATCGWVADKLKGFLRYHPQMKPKDLILEVLDQFGVDISYYTVWKSKVRVLERINGNYETSYHKIAELKTQILKRNERSLAKWYRDQDGEFIGFFLAYKVSLDGFVQGCRPVIGLDGCFLKGKYESYVLSVIGLDAMNGLFPLGIYICRGKDKCTWNDFLKNLKPHLNKHPEKLTFISDRQKGLIDAVDFNFPFANHRYNQFCLYNELIPAVRDVIERLEKKHTRYKVKPEDVVQPPPLERHPENNEGERAEEVVTEGGHDSPTRTRGSGRRGGGRRRGGDNNVNVQPVIDVPKAEVENLQNDVPKARRGGRVGRAGGRRGAGQHVNLQPVIDVPEAELEPEIENLQVPKAMRGGRTSRVEAANFRRYGTRNTGTGKGGGKGLSWWLGEDSQPPSTLRQSTPCIVFSESLTQSQP